MVLNLCRTFGCLPSQLDKEDAQVLRLMEIVRLGSDQEGEPDGQ